MALETTTTTTMENGTGWSGYGYAKDHGSDFCSLEKSIGDVKGTLLMRTGDAEARLGSLISHAEGTVTTEINDAECAIIDKLGAYAADSYKNQSDIALAQSVALNGVERDLQNRIHESRQINTKEMSDQSAYLAARAERIGDKSDAQYADIKNQLRGFEVSVAKQFSVLEVEGLKNTSKILETLSANKYDALKDELDSIRADKYADKYGFNFALQNQELNYLKQMIGSVEQNQKFNSKTTIFGEDNVVRNNQTANQG